jgi:class 3 adenylate cyclase/tetratricopeptide (TPR) repeat protein
MSVVCPSCGQQTPKGFPRCANCGALLDAATAPAREERKVVTVLFCDLVGSTARAEGADPEDVRALLSNYHERVRSELERFGGTVEKFIGDAVMALFGAPTAHEDDPERAVRAALAIREWAAEDGDLQVRIGITTGEALVALGARPETGEGMASGDVVNTAARLQAAAPVGGILVDETTYRGTSHIVDYAGGEPVEAKGKVEPIAVWKAIEAWARLGVDVLRTARTALVGRASELDALKATLARARGQRQPQLVTLVGVPGIGKSRLVYELLQVVEADPELVYWRQGRSLPYGDGVSYWALGEIVKAHAGILETDSADEASTKLRLAVAELIADSSDASWLESHLRLLAGLDVSDELGPERRDEAFGAWRRFLETVADERPLVLVFEDLHWADDGLLDFVDHLAEWSAGVPLLVVATARPELLTRRPSWGGGKANATTVSLSPLSEKETAALLSALLRRPVLAAETQQAVLARAGGNPLYAEQFARMLEERGADGELPVPETVQGIIAARLDALPTDEKQLVQGAAVVGKVFWAGALSAIESTPSGVVEERLHGLARRELVRRERRSSVAGETEYVFQHLLVRDVAYGQIPRARRAETHLAAAAWIESLAPDRAEDRAEMLAHHYASALEYAEAAGRPLDAIQERARLALRDAGDRAFALGALTAAERYYDSAVALWPADDPGRSRLLLERAQTTSYLRPEDAVDRLEEARGALLEAGDVDGAADADAFLVQAWRSRGQPDRAFASLDRGRALVETTPPSRGKARLLSQLARYLMLLDEPDEAIRVGHESLEMAEALGLEELQAHNLITIGTARSALAGGYDDGVAEIERGLEIALSSSTVDAVTRGYVNLASVVGREGDLRRGRELAQEAKRYEERYGIRTRWSVGNEIGDDVSAGDWDRALRLADEFIAECEAGAPQTLESHVRAARARIRLARGNLDGALEDARKGVVAARKTKLPQLFVPALDLCIYVLVDAGFVDEAQTLADELLALPVHDETPLDLSWVAGALGRVEQVRAAVEAMPRQTRWHNAAIAILAGDYPRAAQILDDAGELPAAAYTRLRAAEQLVEAGRAAEADDHLQKALAFWRSVDGTRYLREGEALLAKTA